VATFRVTLKYGPQKERNDHCVVRTGVGVPQAFRVGDTFFSGHPGDDHGLGNGARTLDEPNVDGLGIR
jgi:hypothetical protein